MLICRSLLAVAAAAICLPVWAHDYQAGQIHIDHPYARATVPGQPSGAAYLTLENKGSQADRLTGVSVAPALAAGAEIHTMAMDGNVMKMHEVSGIELAPSAKVTMTPGNGYHIMLLELKQPLKAGDKLPLGLSFEKAGKIEVIAEVESIRSSGTKGMKGAKGATGATIPMHTR